MEGEAVPSRRGLFSAIKCRDTSPRQIPRGKFFSVVHHPGNTALGPSMAAFRQLLGVEGRFSSFTSDRIVNAAATFPALREWATWYKELYRV